MNLKCLSIFVLIAFVCSPMASAQTVNDNNNDVLKKENKALAQELAECGGAYSAMSKVLLELNKKNSSLSYEDTMRGAYFAGAYLAHISDIITDWSKAIQWAENIKESQSTFWLGMIELHTSSDKEPLPQEFISQLHLCSSLNLIQTKLIEELRLSVYSESN